MKKKQITKLFAVVALAASPAAADPAPQPDPWAMSATVSRLMPDASRQAISIGLAALARPIALPWVTEARALRADPSAVAAVRAMASDPSGLAAAARPRVMPSGAPACGNVATRAARPAECE